MNVLAFYNVLYYTTFRVENKCMPQEHDTPSNVETLLLGRERWLLADRALLLQHCDFLAVSL